ncbi:MAG TPA: glycosyltransferase family 2 protein [Anaerolineae bacterium]|nr:glycosyltransferase family 2 protein [Anaerolineae bacterium]
MNNLLQASIIIATYNRAFYLSRCLAALATLETDPTKFEIIIVDNNSSDNTRDISLNFTQAHLTLKTRYMCEIKQGSSHARNRGVEESCGEIVCFLDDDSVPTPDWLNVLLEMFNDPQMGCVGGPSILDYQGQELPYWLQGDLQGLLSSYALPYSEPTQVSRWTEFPLSCNMAIRRSIFTDLGFLRTDLGKLADQTLAAGDTELADRITKAGWKVVYVPEMCVRHFVQPEKLSITYLYQRGRGLAESHIILTSDDSRPHMIGRWFISDLWYSIRMLFWLIVAILRRKQLWFDDYMRFWMVANRIPLRMKILQQRYFQFLKAEDQSYELSEIEKPPQPKSVSPRC